MMFSILLVTFLFYLNHAQCAYRSGSYNLLSLLSSNWKLRSYTSLGLNPPKCSVISSHHSRSPYITMYGLSRHYTAVLTGYYLDGDKTKPRSNKGILYGLNAKVRPSITGKARFLFHSDFEMPFIKHGEGDEFCCHIYAPPFQMGPTLKRALGTRYNDPKRFFGSDERLDMIIKKEGNPNSRRITSCCFIID